MFKVTCEGNHKTPLIFGTFDTYEKAQKCWSREIDLCHNQAQKSRGTEFYNFWVHCFNTMEIKEEN